MGFFSDLKEDLSQAVNELIPEDGAEAKEAEAENTSGVEVQEEEKEPQTVNNFHADLSAMLDHVDDTEPEEEEDEGVYVAPVVPEKPGFEQRTSGFHQATIIRLFPDVQRQGTKDATRGNPLEAVDANIGDGEGLGVNFGDHQYGENRS